MFNKSYFLLIFFLFFSLSVNANLMLIKKFTMEIINKEIFVDDKIAYLTVKDTDKILAKAYPEFEDSGYYEQLDFVKKALKDDPLSPQLALLLFSTQSPCPKLPPRIELSWIELLQNQLKNKKILGWLADWKYNIFQANPSEYEYASWMPSDDKSFIKTFGMGPLIKDEQELRALSLKYINLYLENSKNILRQAEYRGITKPLIQPFDILTLKKAIEGEVSDISALFIASEGLDMVGLPTNLTKSWWQIVLDLTKNPKIQSYAKKTKENIELWEEEENRIRSSYWLRSNETYHNQILYKEEFSDVNELKKVTLEYINLFQQNVSPATFEDLYSESQFNFDGDYTDEINEGLAQTLAEAALKLALAEDSGRQEVDARALLGYILINAYNSDINNRELAEIHMNDALERWLANCEVAILNNEYGYEGELIKDWISCSAGYELSSATLSNVLNLMFFSGETTFKTVDKSELLNLYQYLEKRPHEITLLDEAPLQNDEALKKYPKKLQAESYKKKDSRIFLYSCMTMEDYWHLFSVDEVLQCYRTLYSQNIKKASSKLSSDDSRILNDRLARLNRIKDNKISLNKNYDVDTYFNNLYQVELGGEIDEGKEVLPAAAGKYALVIGNSNYNTLGKLKTPKNDAKNISKTLIAMGYQVSTYFDLSYEDFQTAITQFSLDAKNAKVSIVYYSGHAYQTGGQNFLLPIRDQKLKETDSILVDIDLNKILRQNIPGAKKIVFLDACRNNPYNKQGLAPINIATWGTNTLVSYAAEAGKYAFDGYEKDGLSPYAEALVKNLPNDKDIAVILRMVRLDVKKSTLNKQNTSEYSNLLDNDRL